MNTKTNPLNLLRQAQIKKDSARTKQREEELYDKKAEEATKHAEKLKQDRERCLDRIRGNNKTAGITDMVTPGPHFRLPQAH